MYIAASIYLDVSIGTSGNKFLFFIWSPLCIHLVVYLFNFFEILASIVSIGVPFNRGFHYLHFFSIEKTKSYCNITRLIQIKRYYLSLQINDRLRVLSALYLQPPKSIRIYINPFGRLRLFSIVSLFLYASHIICNLLLKQLLIIILKYYNA